MAIEEEKKPVDGTNVETSEAETADEVSQAELDAVAGGRARG